ncbi:MAG: hypothetical protein HND46_02285 [Chloroflexi bacterium]|nr:hypothetical protein [Chloroflexota bacterium]NOG62223.1 hypothetical protein [Chloroflexota bacterium]
MVQKWEYCEVGDFNGSVSVVIYRSDGNHQVHRYDKLKDKSRIVFWQTVAQLGTEGWEMIVVKNIGETSLITAYFRRPLS